MDDPLDLLDDDGDGVIEICLLDKEDKGGNGNSGCCVFFFLLSSSIILSGLELTKLISNVFYPS